MGVKVKVVLFFCFVFLHAGDAISGSKAQVIEDQKEMALLQCMRMNYELVGVEIKNDWSDFSPRYKSSRHLVQNLEWQSKFFGFLSAKVGDFYKDELSLKAESNKPPFTQIFAKCMEFYKSPELHLFLKKNVPLR